MTPEHLVTFYGWDDGLYVMCLCGWADYLGDQPMTVEGMRIVEQGHLNPKERA